MKKLMYVLLTAMLLMTPVCCAEATEGSVAEATMDSVADSVAEVTEEAVTEEVLAEAITESVAETVAESAAEESVAETTMDSVADSVAEVTEEAVTEAITESVAETTEVPAETDVTVEMTERTASSAGAEDEQETIVQDSFDGLKVTIKTDKNNYQKGESIYVTVELHNTSSRTLKDIQVQNYIPNGFVYKDLTAKESLAQNFLNPGKSKVYVGELYFSADKNNNTPGNNTGNIYPDIDKDKVGQSGESDNSAVVTDKKKPQGEKNNKKEDDTETKESAADSDDTEEDAAEEETESVEDTEESVAETEEEQQEETVAAGAESDDKEDGEKESGNALIIVLIVVASLAVCVVLIIGLVQKKRGPKVLSLILCSALLLSSVNVTEARAAVNDTAVEETIVAETSSEENSISTEIAESTEAVIEETEISAEETSSAQEEVGENSVAEEESTVNEEVNTAAETLQEETTEDEAVAEIDIEEAEKIAEVTPETYNKTAEISFVYNGKSYVVNYSVSYALSEHYIKEAGISIDTTPYNYHETYNAYVVYTNANELKGTMDDVNEYTTLVLEVYNDKDTLVLRKEGAPAEQWSFSPFGLFPGTNRVVVTAEGKETISTSVDMYDVFGNNYEALDGATTDTDGDSVYDLIEEYVGSDISKADTDNDGLTDYQESAELGTDPTVNDTDGNGISDYDEDADGDGISNGQEYVLGIDPVLEDSDFDGLTDSEELDRYHTNPNKADSDDDGADDLWEISMGYDPAAKNDTFVLEYKTGDEVSENSPIIASVKLELLSGDVESLSIDSVTSYDNPLVGPGIAGYLGHAYDFSVDGEFTTAEMTFKYDASVGVLGTDFQPRIYYYNEETMMLEELPNQTVTDGSVTVTVNHFSTYILLNKIEFDKVWAIDIKPTDTVNSGYTGIDVVFVIDSSGSMGSNDRKNLRLAAANAFVDKLGEFDRGAVVDFDSYATVLQDFTSDHQKLKNAIGRINKSGGTNLSRGISTAISLFTNASYVNNNAYKYIVFLTDGNGSYSTTYTQTAANNNIIVYTIGLGSGVKASVLKGIASGTGGKYYFASVAGELGDIYDEISVETVDYTTDSNHDGISDYYTQLIMEGKLVLTTGSRCLSGIDLNYDSNGNLSADWDKDGLLNGQEIMVVTNGNRTSIYMKSNPLMIHSDGDCIPDNIEVQNGTDPLKYTLAANKALVDILEDDSYYDYERVVEIYKDSLLLQGSNGLGSVIFGVWNKKELYRDLIIDYYSKYVTNDTLSQQKTQEVKKNGVEFLNSALDNVKKYGSDPQGLVSKINQTICMVNGIDDETEMAKAFADKVAPTITKLMNISEEATQFRAETYGIPRELQLKNVSDVADQVTGSWKVLDKVGDGLSYVSYGMDVVDTIYNIAQINVNNEAFNTNIDALEDLMVNSEDKYAKSAAQQIRNCVAGHYFSEITKAVTADALESALDFAISKLATKNPYSLAILAVRDAFNMVLGVSEDIKQLYQMLCYHELTKTYIKLFRKSVYTSVEGKYYLVYPSSHYNYMRYLNNLTQIRALGEVQYFEWYEFSGALKGVMNWIYDVAETKKYVNEQLAGIKLISEYLKLTLSSRLKFSV